jgi:transposase
LSSRPAFLSMAPHLATSQHDLIREMIVDGALTAAQMATVATCSTRSVKVIKSNLRHFRTTKALANGGGRRRSITPPMLDALREYLLEKPALYQEEMAVFLWDEFDVLVSTHSISRALKAAKWSKKVARQIANFG